MSERRQMLTEGTYDVIWCPLCGIVAPGPWPVGMAPMHKCQVVTP